MSQEHRVDKFGSSSSSNSESNHGTFIHTAQIVNEPDNQNGSVQENIGNMNNRQQGNVGEPSCSTTGISGTNNQANEEGSVSTILELEEVDLPAVEANNSSNVIRRSRSNPDIVLDNGSPNVPALQVPKLVPQISVTPVEEYDLKIVFVGDFSVGKTAIIQQYLTKEFTENYKVTIGAEFESRRYKFDAKTLVTIRLWDIAGQERSRVVTRQFYRDADVIMLVCDATRYKTFQGLAGENGWIPMLQKEVLQFDSKPVPIILLINKCDLPCQEISTSHITLICSHYSIRAWHYTSAKDDVNIEEAMEYAIRLALEGQRRARAYSRIKGGDNIQLSEQGGNLEMAHHPKCAFKKCYRMS